MVIEATVRIDRPLLKWEPFRAFSHLAPILPAPALGS
jgi:hypothetical protein